jgi:hypothetical protein
MPPVPKAKVKAKAKPKAKPKWKLLGDWLVLFWAGLVIMLLMDFQSDCFYLLYSPGSARSHFEAFLFFFST